MMKKIEDKIFEFNKTLTPEKDKRGIYSDIVTISNGRLSNKKKDSIRQQYLKTFNDMHEIAIDTLKFDAEFILTSNTKGQLGFETFTNVKQLKEGKHVLKIKRLKKIDGGITKVTISSIPFWYYKD